MVSRLTHLCLSLLYLSRETGVLYISDHLFRRYLKLKMYSEPFFRTKSQGHRISVVVRP